MTKNHKAKAEARGLAHSEGIAYARARFLTRGDGGDRRGGNGVGGGGGDDGSSGFAEPVESSASMAESLVRRALEGLPNSPSALGVSVTDRNGEAPFGLHGAELCDVNVEHAAGQPYDELDDTTELWVVDTIAHGTLEGWADTAAARRLVAGGLFWEVESSGGAVLVRSVAPMPLEAVVNVRVEIGDSAELSDELEVMVAEEA